jgi:hypothetical protein
MLTTLVCALVAHACWSANALGTSAAVDATGRLWIAYAQSAAPSTHVMVARSDDEGRSWHAAVRVTAQPEPVAADGENRPKIAFGPRDQIYVSWTSPTSERYTGNIRFARSLDGGRTWSQPIIVHRDRQLIAHRFDSMMVDRNGRIWIAWLDKRDAVSAAAAGRDLTGSSTYYAYSDDQGATWQGDFKLAEQACECCQIALAANSDGTVSAMWRHVFANSERDHAMAVLGRPGIRRVTFDRWRIDACPHHGPSLAVDDAGTAHAVWFNQTNGESRVFYGQLTEGGPRHGRELPAGASHADIAASGETIAIAWKRFDGNAVVIESWRSHDRGQTFEPGPILRTEGDSDRARLVGVNGKVLLVWRRAEGVLVQPVSSASAKDAATARVQPAAASSIDRVKPFDRTTLAQIERTYAGKAFWLVLWDLECSYCAKSLRNLAQAQRAGLRMPVVTIATDSISAAKALRHRLSELGVTADAYAFDDGPVEALRFAIDPSWMGEKPRAYRYDATGKREALNGVIRVDAYQAAEMR